MYPVSMTGAGVALREFTADDLDAVSKVYGDPHVVEHLSFEPRSRDRVAATLSHLIDAAGHEPRVEYSLAVADAASGEVIGVARLAVDVQHPGQSSAQLGFASRPDRWGAGLAAETGRLLFRLGFEDLGLHRLWGARGPDNVAAARLMAKLGMVEEGRIRGHLRVRGAWRDSVVHSILEDDDWRGAS
ncbi:GNAT family N-acetyltransferase [Actinomadura litoris]|uniref:GNAT family N-acetyltransferase n=1 Tax=Actinomadura litoris TaxID=2678616 RepID=A0A7K1LAW4_9ACTN|nr:GNAT family protein [Actinomadura litoris]MUN41558.1 GNAT family N-acetyltransferase [Actinomadura litoris]